MWVLYNAQTGEEIDRVESTKEARSMIFLLNTDPSNDSQAYNLRWED